MALEPFSGASDRVSYAELSDFSDDRLIRELQAGNTDAFAVLFKRYHRLVRVTALHILRDVGEAEDLTQAVFLQVYRRLGQFDPSRATLEVWLLQFAYSRSINRRNYLLVRFHSQVEFSEAEESLSPCSPNRFHVPEAKRLAREALSVLSEPQRETMELFFFEGLTFKEIAERRASSDRTDREAWLRGAGSAESRDRSSSPSARRNRGGRKSTDHRVCSPTN
jgi:RNA polymerase sigma-70 factor (ECF subfamily)